MSRGGGLEQVAMGEEIVITSHGVPVAVLGPVPASRKPDVGGVAGMAIFDAGAVW